MNINKAIVYGRITQDLELKAFNTGVKVLNLSLATNRKYKDSQGQDVDEPEFHNIVCYGKVAETIAQYMKKGSGLYVEGRLKTSSWETDGVKKYKTEIVAEQFQFGERPTDQNQAQPQPVNNNPADSLKDMNQSPTPQVQPQTQPQVQPKTQPYQYGPPQPAQTPPQNNPMQDSTPF